LARKVGIPEERCILATNGDAVYFYSNTGAIVEKVETGRVFVDGKGVGDVGNVVLKDRKHLSEDGMVVIIIGINQSSGAIIHGPDIISRGFVIEDESREYLEDARNVVVAALEEINAEMRCDNEEVKTACDVSSRRLLSADRSYLYLELNKGGNYEYGHHLRRLFY